FKDFQLAPTLEEYKRLLILPLAKSTPYLPEDTSILGFGGQAAKDIGWEGEWPAFMDVYELLVYGIVLFSQIEDHINLVAIGTFLTKRDRGENPVCETPKVSGTENTLAERRVAAQRGHIRNNAGPNPDYRRKGNLTLLELMLNSKG
ncbi:hypothetical protein CR513_10475, partial [Mucuna pruriens]